MSAPKMAGSKAVQLDDHSVARMVDKKVAQSAALTAVRREFLSVEQMVVA